MANKAGTAQGGGQVRRLAKPVRPHELLKCLTPAVAGDEGHVADDEPGTSPNFAAGSRPFAGRRILIAEDNPVNQEVALEMLSLLGAEPAVARDGREAVEALCHAPYDLVLMDCHMPMMDGFEATASIRRREVEENVPRTPIVALTANAVVGDREACLAAGMDDYLSKPFTLVNLAETLLRWLPLTAAPVPLVGQQAPAPVDAATLEPAPSTEPVNARALDAMRQLQRQSGSKLLERVITAYLEDAPRRLQMLKDAVATMDSRGMQKAAHAWKSSSMNVGAENLAESLKKLESMGRGDVMSGADELVACIEAEYGRVSRWLSEELKGVCCHAVQ